MGAARSTRNRTFAVTCGALLTTLGLTQIALRVRSESSGDWFSLAIALVEVGMGITILVLAARTPKPTEEHADESVDDG
jgi:hypothetical protein